MTTDDASVDGRTSDPEAGPDRAPNHSTIDGSAFDQPGLDRLHPGLDRLHPGLDRLALDAIREAVGAVHLHRWSEVGPRLRIRATPGDSRHRPAQRPTGLHRVLGTTTAGTVSLEVGLAITVRLGTGGPGGGDHSTTGLCVRPTAAQYAAWGRPAEVVWRVAAGNARHVTGPNLAVRDGLLPGYGRVRLRLAAGNQWTTGALHDVGYFVRRWWPDARRWHGAGSTGSTGGRRPEAGWACALSRSSIAVVEPVDPSAPLPDRSVAERLLRPLADVEEQPFPLVLIAAGNRYDSHRQSLR